MLVGERPRELQRAGGRGRRVHGLSGCVFVHAWRGSSQDGHRISPLKVHHRRGVVPCPSRSPPISSPPVLRLPAPSVPVIPVVRLFFYATQSVVLAS